LVNPQLIVEVLSESTERYDRGDKWLAYRTIPSLTDYVMVSSTRREVEHYQRCRMARGRCARRSATVNACLRVASPST